MGAKGLDRRLLAGIRSRPHFGWVCVKNHPNKSADEACALAA